MCADSRPQQVRAYRKRSRAPVPQASENADDCHFSKSPTLSPRHSQRLLTTALVGDRSPRNTAMTGWQTESSHDFAVNFDLNLPRSTVLYHFVYSNACVFHLSVWTSEGQICPGSCEVKINLFCLLCGPYHLYFIFIRASNAKIQL